MIWPVSQATLTRRTRFRSHVVDRSVERAGWIGPSSWRTSGHRLVTITVTMSRRRDPRDPTAEMAHIVPPIAGSAQRRELVSSPALAGDTIDRIALLTITFAITKTACVEPAINTGPTELCFGPISERFQADQILGSAKAIRKEQRAEWVGSFLHTADRLMPKWPRIKGSRLFLRSLN